MTKHKHQKWHPSPALVPYHDTGTASGDDIVCKMVVSVGTGGKGSMEGPWPRGDWQWGLRQGSLPHFSDFRYWQKHEGRGPLHFGLREKYGDMEIVPPVVSDEGIIADESFLPKDRAEGWWNEGVPDIESSKENI